MEWRGDHWPTRVGRRGRADDRLALVPPVAAPDHAERIVLADEVAGLLARVPDLEREALLLIAWEGLQIQEAALVLGCPPALLRVRLFRLRRRLRQLPGGAGSRPVTLEVAP